jgi:zinc/manganese transport system ATP-binding protein
VSALTLDDVSIRLGGHDILSSVSLAVEEGEFIGILGPNGAGKTTLIRAILGLVKPSAGALRVLGAPPGVGRTAVGYMPQSRTIAANLRFTGWDFVASAAGGHRWGLPRLDAGERRDVEHALDLTGARGLSKKSLHEMSGGERQRLLLSQALLGKPRLLLLDEPLISLDPRRQGDVVALVRRLCDDLGITILFSAHELNPLLGAIDRVLYMGGGGAVLGAVDEVITAPVLSRLYGAPIDVLRTGGRIFVMNGGFDLERDAHRHDHDHAHGPENNARV